MKQLKFLAIAILGIMTFISCSSDDEGSNYNPNDFIEVRFDEAYLEGDKWYYLDVLDQNGKSIIETALEDCSLDDYFIFDDITKDYEINESKISCSLDPDKDILDSGKYSIVDSNGVITINLDNGASITKMENVKMLRDQNGFGNIKIQFTITTDSYTYELRKGVFN